MLKIPSFIVLGSCPDSVPEILDRALEAVAGWLQPSWLKLKSMKDRGPVLELGDDLDQGSLKGA